MEKINLEMCMNLKDSLLCFALLVLAILVVSLLVQFVRYMVKRERLRALPSLDKCP